MFSYQNAPKFFSSETTMTNYTGHWSYDQHGSIPNPCLPYGGPPETVNNHNDFSTWFAPQQPVTVQKQNFEANNFQNNTFSQYNSVQFATHMPTPVPLPAFNAPKPVSNNNTMAKRHRAMRTFVPTQTGNFKAIVKRKRKRTVFTTEQLEALEEIYKKKQYITREERAEIVEQLHINDKAVKVWFQNRRLKYKNKPEEAEDQQETKVEVNGPNVSRLDNLESKIYEKSDENEYVTLDDSLIKDLFNVIDDVPTTKDTDVPVQEECSPIYEPISPASVSDSNAEEQAPCWQPSEPSESLQRLFDLQTLLLL